MMRNIIAITERITVARLIEVKLENIAIQVCKGGEKNDIKSTIQYNI